MQSSAQQKGIDLKQAELEVFGTPHCQVGAYLLWLWGLPDAITEIVAHCEQPRLQASQIPLLAVHVADALVTDGSERNIDINCLTRTGLVGHLAEWKQLGEELRSGSSLMTITLYNRSARSNRRCKYGSQMESRL